jgi:hypothetical protein
MAKKIFKYELDNSISDEDLLLGSDAENSSKTKTYKVQDLVTFVVPPNPQPGDILKSDGEGGVYWSPSNDPS